MSDSIYQQIQRAMAQKNTALTGVYGRDGQRLFLLKTAGNTQRFTSVYEVTSGYLTQFDEFRETMLFKIAIEDSVNFSDKLAQTSYIGFGVPNVSGQIEVYYISPEARDRVAPNAKDVHWKLYATRKPEMRYTIIP